MKHAFTKWMAAALCGVAMTSARSAVIGRDTASLGAAHGAALATGTHYESPANFSPDGTRAGAPLVPEPSPQTALYVLSGAVGLGFVVLRRRTPA